MEKPKKPQSPLEALMGQMAAGNLDRLANTSEVQNLTPAAVDTAVLEDKNSTKTITNNGHGPSRTPSNEVRSEEAAPYPTGPRQAVGELRSIHWSHIRPWKLADRPENEFGNMDEFVQDVKLNGQHTPIIVRPIAGTRTEFEFLVGNRRWNACKDLDIDVLCLVRALNDEQAFAIMHSENDDRESISPWAKGISFASAIDKGAFKSTRALAAKLGKGHSYVNDLLIYSRIPDELSKAIGPMTKVSQNTAKVICQLSKADKGNLPVLKELASKIANGLARTSLLKEVQKLQGTYIEDVVTLKGKGGNYCTLRADSNGTPVFSLLKDARNFIDHEAFQADLIKLIDHHYEKHQTK